MVRYTGIEFGNGAIVPRTPREILARRFGDCKDQAALLVAMLRAAGLQADVALLSAGTGIDVVPELPGLGGFNHAIVRLAGDPPLWIDPTIHCLPAGRLPRADQGAGLCWRGATPRSWCGPPWDAIRSRPRLKCASFFPTSMERDWRGCRCC